MQLERIKGTVYYKSQLGPVCVIVDEKGYMNGSKLAKSAGKRYAKWNENKNTESFKQTAADVLGVDQSELCYTIRGGGSRSVWGTYMHPILITHLAQWMSPSFGVQVSLWIEEWIEMNPENKDRYYQALSEMTLYQSDQEECLVQERLHELIGGEREVSCVHGRIDLLTDRLLIEVKSCADWMKAIGQLICYSTDYPGHQLCLYTYDGCLDDEQKEVCQANRIKAVSSEAELAASQDEVKKEKKKVSRLEKLIAEVREENRLARLAREKQEKNSRKTHSKLGVISEELGEVKGELGVVKGELGSVSRKLGVAKREKTKHVSVLLRHNWEEEEDSSEEEEEAVPRPKPKYHYSLLRIQRGSLETSLANKRRNYPDLEGLGVTQPSTQDLKVEVIGEWDTPNSMNIWHRYRDVHGHRIKKSNNNFSLRDDYSERRMIRHLNRLVQSRLEEEDLE